MTDLPDTDTLKGPDRVWLDWPGANRGEIVYDEPPERDTQPGQIGYVRADLHAALAARVIEQDAEIERLRNALRFYADVSKYPAPLTGGAGALWSDCGQVARAALEDGQ